MTLFADLQILHIILNKILGFYDSCKNLANNMFLEAYANDYQ